MPVRHRKAHTPRIFNQLTSEPAVCIATPVGPVADPASLPITPLSTVASPSQTPAVAVVDPTDPLLLKLKREHAYRRQLILHIADRAKPTLALTVAAARTKSGGWGGHRARGASEHDTADLWADIWADSIVQGDKPELVDADMVAAAVREGERDGEAIIPVAREVKLADLIRPPRASKTLRKSKESDFEVVPHVRSVIVLDDSEVREGPDSEPDADAWEYVSSADDEDEPKTILSYAEIVARKAT